MSDVQDTVGWICELIAERNAQENGTDYTILLDDDGTFALFSLENSKVYLITVREARFVPAPPSEKEDS